MGWESNSFNGISDSWSFADLSGQFGSAMKNLGPSMAISGVLNGAIGSYYSAKASQSNLRFQADMAEINARTAESNAQSILRQGEKQIGQVTMRAGKVKSSQRAAMAANGVDLSEGNAVEVQASTDIIKEMDALTINASAVQAAGAARTQGVNQSNQALIGRTSANNMNPGSMAFSTLLSNASMVAGTWFRDPKYGTYSAG